MDNPRGGWAVRRASATMISMAVESATRDDRVLPRSDSAQ
jgi:hypothetical protein